MNLILLASANDVNLVRITGDASFHLNENYKMFKNGASAGEIIPTIRLVSPGVKVSINVSTMSDLMLEDTISSQVQFYFTTIGVSLFV